MTVEKFDKLLVHYPDPTSAIEAVVKTISDKIKAAEIPGVSMMVTLCGDDPAFAYLHRLFSATMWVAGVIGAWRSVGAIGAKTQDPAAQKEFSSDVLSFLRKRDMPGPLQVAGHIAGPYKPEGTEIELNIYECALILWQSRLLPASHKAVLTLPADHPFFAIAEEYGCPIRNSAPTADHPDKRDVTVRELSVAYASVRNKLMDSAMELFEGAPMLKLY